MCFYAKKCNDGDTGCDAINNTLTEKPGCFEEKPLKSNSESGANVPLDRLVIATADHFKRMNRKLSAMSDEKAAELLDKVFNEHECTPADEKLMKTIADLVEGVEL